jgi:peptide/nickel transport system substrate-binding protein
MEASVSGGRSWLRRTVVAAGAILLLTAAGCSAGASTGGGATNNSLVIGLTSEPENLDYSTTDGAAIPQILLDNVYQGLVKIDDKGQIVPSLATKWDVSPDLKSYTFTLQPNVTFSNGKPFDANSVKFSIERVKNGGWTTSLASQMSVVDSVQVDSPTQVTVHLSKPSNDWLFHMGTRVGTMYSPDGVGSLTTTPVGTGPYVVKSWTKGTSVVLERRADYWGPAPAMASVTFQFFKDVNAENSALLSGGINVIANLGSLDTLQQFTDPKRFQTITGLTNSEVVLSMNNASGVFTDKRIRQAVSYAIDRKALVASTVDGHGTMIGSMVPPSDPWYEDLTNVYPYDPAKARQLLAEAGNPTPTIRFRIPSTPATMVSAAQVVKSDLAKVGINAQIDVLDFPAQWLDQVFTKHDYDMSIVNHLEPRDIVTFAQPKYYWGYDNPEVQRLVDQADAGTPEQQVADLKQVARIITADSAADWLYLEQQVTVADADLKGLPTNNLGEAYDVAGVTR